MKGSVSPLTTIVDRWSALAPLDAGDAAAIHTLPHNLKTFEPGQLLIREGDRPTQVCLLKAGFMARQKVVGDGARQILAIHVAGDWVDLQHLLLDHADHSVQALTMAQTVLFPREAVIGLAAQRPGVAMALWRESLIDASLMREWTANIGRRTAQTRLAHLLCELMVRLRDIGQGEGNRYEIPMTQEQLADCTGMTPIHLNRMLMSLEHAGAITRRGRVVRILNWDQLTALGDFDAAYLHRMPDAQPRRRLIAVS